MKGHGELTSLDAQLIRGRAKWKVVAQVAYILFLFYPGEGREVTLCITASNRLYGNFDLFLAKACLGQGRFWSPQLLFNSKNIQ